MFQTCCTISRRPKTAIDGYSLETAQQRAAQGGQSSEFAEKTLTILRPSSRAMEAQLADSRGGGNGTQGIADNTPLRVTIVYGEDNLNCERIACQTTGLVQLSDEDGGTIAVSNDSEFEWNAGGQFMLSRGEVITGRWNDPIRVEGSEGGSIELSGISYRARVDDNGIATGVSYSGPLEYSFTGLPGPAGRVSEAPAAGVVNRFAQGTL